MSDTIRIQIYTRSGCCLCDEARETILKTAKGYPVLLEEVDIGEDTVLSGRFGQEIPVVFLDGKKLFKFRVDPEKLMKAIVTRLDEQKN